MQFHKEGDRGAAYGVKETWEVALDDPGASQMRYLKQLMLSKPYFERVPAQEIIADKQGDRYDYLAATRGKNYSFIYTCNGRTMDIDLDKLPLTRIKASWYNPRNGVVSDIGIYTVKGIKTFDPPGEVSSGNDWVLVLE